MHRAASVYVPRVIVMVNPPSLEKVRKIRQAGGPEKALSWALSGFDADSFEAASLTEDSLRADLLSKGLPGGLIDQFILSATSSGAIGPSDGAATLQEPHLSQAQSGAVNIALALSDSRTRVKDLVSSTHASSLLGNKYRIAYPAAFRRMGLETIEFLDSFPVLTGSYGYTRGDSTPGASRLVPFKDRRGKYVVYGDIMQTEALFVRLAPALVAEWLRMSGYTLPDWSDDRTARIAILQSAIVPESGSSTTPETTGSRLLTLVHSYAHWFIRQLAVRAGIERNSLSEFLVAEHCGFIVYAAARGDFVLGGLQAVFETELDSFLGEIAAGDLRCPLDPGCRRGGGACVACLHLGEPSCRYYNTYLSRVTLAGQAGFLEHSRSIKAGA